MKLLPFFVLLRVWFLSFSARTLFSPVLPLFEEGLQISHRETEGLFTSLTIGFSMSMLVFSQQNQDNLLKFGATNFEEDGVVRG